MLALEHREGDPIDDLFAVAAERDVRQLQNRCHEVVYADWRWRNTSSALSA
jgi:hypothetical protein